MVLVTGGTGFIGAYIISNLVKKGYPVRAIRRSNHIPAFIPKEVLEKVDWVKGDVLDISLLCDAMDNVEAVIHSAAVVSFHARDRHRMYETNIEGTANVVNVALEKKIGRFVHISSVAAVGRTAAGEVVTEEKKWEETRQNTHYAITKRQAELEVWRGFAEGLNGVIVNPSTVIGYGDWHQSSSAIFRNVYKEFPWYTKGINGFVGVEDVAEATVRLMETDFTEQRFILNADNWSFQQLFDTIADGFQKRKPHRLATPFLGEIAWRIEAFKKLFADGKPLLTRESSRVAHSVTRFDASAILKALPGFKFTPLNDVINDACKKYLESLQAGKISLHRNNIDLPVPGS
jgi:dihydroflavonol-4-reductase